MNPTLLAREAASSIGALDPKPEPQEVLTKPTRLIRVVEFDEEVWIDPVTGRKVEDETTGN